MRREHIIDSGWWEMPGEPVPALGWPGTKNGENHRVWLPKVAQALLAELDGEATGGFVFAGPRGGPIHGLDGAMRYICASSASSVRRRTICGGPTAAPSRRSASAATR